MSNDPVCPICNNTYCDHQYLKSPSKGLSKRTVNILKWVGAIFGLIAVYLVFSLVEESGKGKEYGLIVLIVFFAWRLNSLSEQLCRIEQKLDIMDNR